MNPILGGLAVVASLFLFVMIHEAGHFIAAKMTKMKATEFFFGFGPRLFSFTWGETEYGIKAIPAGGYVRIIGMNPLEEVDPADVGRTYREKHFWEKAFVVLAGIAMNFGLAFVLIWGVFFFGGQEQEPVPIVADIVADIDGNATPAAQAGLQPGDEFVSVDDVVITEWSDLTNYVGGLPEEQVDLVILRDGAEISYTVTLTTLRFEDGTGRGFLGVAPLRPILELGAFTSAGMAGEWVWAVTIEAYGFLFDILGNVPEIMSAVFNGEEVSAEIRPISVVGLWQIGAQADQFGWIAMVMLMAQINIVLAAMNVLPLFPLDGGHFAVAVYEKLFRREADIRKLVPVALTVIVFFIFLGVLSIYLDISQPFQF